MALSLRFHAPKRRCGSVSALELATIVTVLTFVIMMITLQIPATTATSSAILILMVTIGLPHKGKQADTVIRRAWQGLA